MENIWNDRVWQDEELLKKFKRNSSIILDCQLAIENYEDFNSQVIEEFQILNNLWKEEKSKKTINSDNEMYTISQLYIEKYYQLIDKIGKGNFIFYEDGAVEYKKS